MSSPTFRPIFQTVDDCSYHRPLVDVPGESNDDRTSIAHLARHIRVSYQRRGLTTPRRHARISEDAHCDGSYALSSPLSGTGLSLGHPSLAVEARQDQQTLTRSIAVSDDLQRRSRPVNVRSPSLLPCQRWGTVDCIRTNSKCEIRSIRCPCKVIFSLLPPNLLKVHFVLKRKQAHRRRCGCCRGSLASHVDGLDPTIWMSASWPLQRNGSLDLFPPQGRIFFTRAVHAASRQASDAQTRPGRPSRDICPDLNPVREVEIFSCRPVRARLQSPEWEWTFWQMRVKPRLQLSPLAHIIIHLSATTSVTIAALGTLPCSRNLVSFSPKDYQRGPLRPSPCCTPQ